MSDGNGFKKGLDLAAATVVPVPPATTPQPPREAPKLRVLDVDRMLTTDPEPLPWRVDPLLVDGMVTMLAGREGEGKSMLALALAAAIGTGATSLAGMKCAQGRALVVDAENGERECHRRLKGLGISPGASLIYVEADGFNLATDLGELVCLLDLYRPDVLVLDSFRSLAPGLEENDSGDCERAIAPLRSLVHDKHLPALLLHHSGKGGNDYRGSTAIGAAVELGFTLSRNPDDPEGKTRRRLTCWKCRPAPEPKDRWIKLSLQAGLVLIGEADAFVTPESRPAMREELKDEIRELFANTDRRLSQGQILRGVGRSKGDGTGRRAIDELVEEGYLEHHEDGFNLAPATSANEGCHVSAATPQKSLQNEGCQGVKPLKGPDTLTPPSETEPSGALRLTPDTPAAPQLATPGEEASG
jgi:hypothetical protein